MPQQFGRVTTLQEAINAGLAREVQSYLGGKLAAGKGVIGGAVLDAFVRRVFPKLSPADTRAARIYAQQSIAVGYALTEAAPSQLLNLSHLPPPPRGGKRIEVVYSIPLSSRTSLRGGAVPIHAAVDRIDVDTGLTKSQILDLIQARTILAQSQGQDTVFGGARADVVIPDFTGIRILRAEMV